MKIYCSIFEQNVDIQALTYEIPTEFLKNNSDTLLLNSLYRSLQRSRTLITSRPRSTIKYIRKALIKHTNKNGGMVGKTTPHFIFVHS